MKKQLCKSLAAIALTAVCALPAMCQYLPQYAPKQTQTEKNKENFLGQFIVSDATRKEFAESVKKGDLAAMQRIMVQKKYMFFLRDKIKGKSGEEAYPICVAAENGHTAMVKYMAKKDPALLELECENKMRNTFDAAVENGHADTAMALLALKVDPDRSYKSLIKVAQNIKDTASLKKLIPALLNAGVDPHYVYYETTRSRNGDSFYAAARNGNTNFIVVLRDELKKRGKKPEGHMTHSACEGRYSGTDIERWTHEMETGKEAQLLKKYGVEMHGNVSSFYDSSCD